MSVPALRFPEFKGEWEPSKLKDLSNEKFSNGVFNDPLKVGSGYQIINVKDMYVDGAINPNNLQRVAISGSEFSKNKAEYGDVFFTRSSLVKEGIAHSNVLLENSDEITFDGHLIRLRPDRKRTCPVCLYYLFKTSNLRRQFIARGKTGTMTTIGQDDIASVSVALPSLSEQKKIAAFLGVVDEKLAALGARKAGLETYKRGLMQKLFSRTLRFTKPDGSPFPDWEEKRLGDFVRVFSGGTPSASVARYYSGSIPFIKSGEIGGITTTQFLSDEGFKSSSAKLIEVGDLLYALYGATTGEVRISRMAGAINQAVLCIRTKQSTEYLLHWLRYFKEPLKAKFLQGGQGNFSADIVKRIKIELPSPDEQTLIANALQTLDAKIQTTADQIARMEAFKKGLLQQMFV